MADIISKLKEANLLGRGGAAFPTGLKWESVAKASGEKKYVICNASEGEPNVFKDDYILEHYAAEVVEGIVLAMETIGAAEAYIYLNPHYFDKYEIKLKEIIDDKPIHLFKKPPYYIGGEETVACNLIEGKKMEPRQKPPFISEVGLFGCPTLMNNVETFYYVNKINKGEYKTTRFYSVNGEVNNPGVYELSAEATIADVLNQTNNFPNFNFFIQVGGGASGEILLADEISQPVKGAGSITVYNQETADPYKIMANWADFFLNGNCDKCVPCREGIYRLREIILKRELKKEELESLFNVLEKASFCALGRGATAPFRGLITKVLKAY